MSSEKKYPLGLSTLEKRAEHLKQLKLFFFIPLIIIVISAVLGYFIEPFFILTGVSFICIWLFLLYFHIENLIVMWQTKHIGYFWVSVIIGIVGLFFFFEIYLPFLKNEITLEEFITDEKKEEKKPLTKAQIEKINLAEEEDSKGFVYMLIVVGIIIVCGILFFLIKWLF